MTKEVYTYRLEAKATGILKVNVILLPVFSSICYQSWYLGMEYFYI